MKQFMKNYSLGALACMVMGIALIIDPHIITDVLNTAVGVILIAWAAFGLVNFLISRTSDRKEKLSIFSLFSNLIILAAGIFVFVNTDLLEKIVMLALGFYLLFTGLPKVFTAFKIKKSSPDRWLLPLITSLASTVLGAVIIIAPTTVSGNFMRFAGFILAAAGIVCFISGLSTAKYLKQVSEDIKYKKGKMKDNRDTYAEDKANAVDVDAD